MPTQLEACEKAYILSSNDYCRVTFMNHICSNIAFKQIVSDVSSYSLLVFIYNMIADGQTTENLSEHQLSV